MFELRLQCPASDAEPVSAALEAAGALSVSVEDADAGTEAESALFGEPGLPTAAVQGWKRCLLQALFKTAADAEASARALTQASWSCRDIALAEVADQDWVRLTQSQFAPVPINTDFWIVPSWHEPPAGASRVLRLDPGLAFGTGTHATTQMCLRWIAARPGRFERVLDYGCGSGILAIAAALHGAVRVDAVDIDAGAIDATRANAQANGVTLRAAHPEQTAAEPPYQLVLANILASPLKVLAPLLCAHLADDGCLVLAGILERQVAELQQAYAPYRALSVTDAQDGWVLMTAGS